MKSTIQDALKKVFNPEFLNRIDDVITFRPLEKEDIFQIIDLLSKELFKRVSDLGYAVDMTKGAKEFLTGKGFDQKYGARPLQRAIQKYVEDPLAEDLLEVDYPQGTTVKIKMNKSRDGLAFEWETPENTSDEAGNGDADDREESPSEAKA